MDPAWAMVEVVQLKCVTIKYNQTQERIAVFYKYRIKVQPSSTTTKLDS